LLAIFGRNFAKKKAKFAQKSWLDELCVPDCKFGSHIEISPNLNYSTAIEGPKIYTKNAFYNG